MEVKEFTSVVPGSKILTPEEENEVINHINSVVSLPISFPERERAGTCLCFRF